MHSQFSNNGAIAQLVEQRTENPCVPGSIPGGTTSESESYRKCSSFFYPITWVDVEHPAHVLIIHPLTHFLWLISQNIWRHEKHLPLQGAGFPSEVGKPFRTAVLRPEAAAYAVNPLIQSNIYRNNEKPHRKGTVIPMRLYGNDFIGSSPSAILSPLLSAYIAVSDASVG